MSGRTEKWYPYILGLIAPAAALFLRWRDYSPPTPQVEHALNGIAGLGGIIVGFLATALAILFTLPDGPGLRYLRRQNGLKKLVGYFESAIIWWLCATAFSLLLLFFLPDIRQHKLLFEVGLVWSYVLGGSVFLFYRAAALVAQFLRSLN